MSSTAATVLLWIIVFPACMVILVLVNRAIYQRRKRKQDADAIHEAARRYRETEERIKASWKR